MVDGFHRAVGSLKSTDFLAVVAAVRAIAEAAEEDAETAVELG